MTVTISCPNYSCYRYDGLQSQDCVLSKQKLSLSEDVLVCRKLSKRFPEKLKYALVFSRVERHESRNSQGFAKDSPRRCSEGARVTCGEAARRE